MNFFKNRTNVTVAVIIIIVLALGYYLSNPNKTSNKSSKNESKTTTNDQSKSATKSATTENAAMGADNIVSLTPAKDASVTTAPTSVSMKFSKKIEGGSEIKVTAANGADVVPSANIISADLMNLSVPVNISAKGTYTVKYSVNFQGGTTSVGSYTFTYK